MPVNPIYAAGIGFFLGVVFNLVFRKACVPQGALTSKGVPCVGGLSLGLSFLAAAGIGLAGSQGISYFWTQILILALTVLLFGALDDLKNLSVRTKFAFQLLVVAFLIGMGVRTKIACLSEGFNILLTAGWLLWIFNVFNLLDVMDGLAGGVAVIVSAGFFAVSFAQSGVLAFLSLALAACLLSFLAFNFPPARIYMGNSGSYFLGFVLGTVSLLISYASATNPVALATPLLILGFPLFDTVFLVAMRLRHKRSVFRKSEDHICLRCLALGYSKKKTLFFLWSMCLFYTSAGFLVDRASNAWGAGILAVLFVISLKIAGKAAAASVHG